MNILFSICENIFNMLNEMAPYLLLGFGLSGLLSVLVSQDKIQDKIGSNNFSSTLKAVLYGIPLPLCSCGVIPVATSLKKHGASKGSVIAFITTTPQTGVDSIMLTYGMLGAPILFLKLSVALISGLFSGVLTNSFDSSADTKDKDLCYDECCDTEQGGIIKRALSYGFKTLPKDIVEPLLVGLILAGFIGLLAQDDFSTIRDSIFGYSSIVKILIIMVISIPLYICATASIPIALMIATTLGSPGAAIALLIAGPATNLSTIATCIKIVGKKSTFIYVGTVFIFALIAGIIADNITLVQNSVMVNHEHMDGMHSSVFSYICMFALLGVLFGCVFNKKQLDKSRKSIQINVKGMTCSHCESNVVKGLMGLEGTISAQANHETGEVVLNSSSYDSDKVKAVIESYNYEVI